MELLAVKPMKSKKVALHVSCKTLQIVFVKCPTIFVPRSAPCGTIKKTFWFSQKDVSGKDVRFSQKSGHLQFAQILSAFARTCTFEKAWQTLKPIQKVFKPDLRTCQISSMFATVRGLLHRKQTLTNMRRSCKDVVGFRKQDVELHGSRTKFAKFQSVCSRASQCFYTLADGAARERQGRWKLLIRQPSWSR